MITYDTLGRMDRASIIEYIRRNLASLRPISVDPNTGVEATAPPPILNAAFSTEEITFRINSSLTKTFLLINAQNRAIYQKSVYYDIHPGIAQYPWPNDMAMILDLRWKSQSVSPSRARTQDYKSIARVETSNPSDFQPAVGRPSWRWEGPVFVLNSPPEHFQTGTNFRGIWLTYISWIQPLTSDTDVLPMPYAPIMQEVIAYDTAVDLIRTKEFLIDISVLQASLSYWNTQLEILVRNGYNPVSGVQLVNKRPYVYNSFSGR